MTLTTVDALSEALRRRILDGDLAPGTPLREEALSREYDVARHSLRSALRTLQGEGLVQIEPNRGARVKSLSPEDVRGLSRAAHRARGRGRAHGARAGGRRRCPRASTAPPSGWRPCAAARGRPGARWPRRTRRFTTRSCSLPTARASPRSTSWRAPSCGCSCSSCPPTWTLERMAADHLALVERLESEGAEALRPHIEESTRALLEG